MEIRSLWRWIDLSCKSVKEGTESVEPLHHGSPKHVLFKDTAAYLGFVLHPKAKSGGLINISIICWLHGLGKSKVTLLLQALFIRGGQVGVLKKKRVLEMRNHASHPTSQIGAYQKNIRKLNLDVEGFL